MKGMGKNKIALFFPILGGGGVERVGFYTAMELVRRGYSVEIIVARAASEFAHEAFLGVSVVDLGIPPGRGRLFLYPWLLFLSAWRLARHLWEHPPDVLWSSTTEASLVAILALLFARVRSRLIVSEHGTLSVRTKGSPLRTFLPLLVRLLYPRADRIHAVSEGVADDLARVTGLQRRKIQVIYNPVVTPNLFTKAEEPLDHPWFQPGEPPVVLGVGRLTAEKDFPTLIRAFALVRKERPARLMILGEGEDRPKLEALVRKLGLEEDVAMPGFVENPYKYMKRAGVFVLSSKWEGLPTVLIEAMALGTPVVSTHCPSGPREILEDGKWGVLVPVGDTMALAQAIVGTLHQPNPARLKGAMERAKMFTVDRIVTEYLRLLFPEDIARSEVGR